MAVPEGHALKVTFDVTLISSSRTLHRVGKIEVPLEFDVFSKAFESSRV
jgi:hypothetical protein